MKKFIDWLKSPLGIGMETTVVGFLLTVSYDLLKDKPVLSTILSILSAIWKFVLAFLNFELKVWWILLGIIVLLEILYIFIKIYEAKNSDILNTGNIYRRQRRLMFPSFSITISQRL